MRQLAFLMIVLILFTACENQDNYSEPSLQDMMETVGDIAPNLSRAAEKGEFLEYDEDNFQTNFQRAAKASPRLANMQSNQPIEEKQTEKKLIRTASIHIKVENYEKARPTLDELLKQFQAEITNEMQSTHSNGVSYDFTIRILPADFESFIAKIEELASFVYGKRIDVQDVTRQYVDLETRLASKRAVIAQYRALLQDAKSVEDVLAVSEELNEVIEDVESTEAQLRALRNDVQYSTINLTIFDEHTIPNIERENFFSRIGKGLFNGWQLLLNIFVGLITIWPVVLIAIGGVWLLRRWWKRRKAKA